MLLKFLFCFSCGLSTCVATSFSFGESIEAPTYADLVELIMKHKDYCIEDAIEEKIYLKSENIFKTPDGIFLRFSDHFLVELPMFFSNETGCFISPFPYQQSN